MKKDNLKIALIFDMHPFDEIEFNNMFRRMEGIEVYPQLIENFKFDYAGNNDKYDGFVFYNMTLETPDPNEEFSGGKKKTGETLFKIGESGQGVVVLHHAILSHPNWNVWNELVDISDRSFDYFGGVDLDIHVEDKNNPITKGMEDWKMIDETFLLDDCGKNSKVVLSTTNEKSIKSLAWTHDYKKSRVFCMSLGHDMQAFTNVNFENVLRNAILWTCNRL